ncbi:MAG: hypothetical protein ACE5RQ_03470 [Nitrosopumilus sp.]|jgi:hypothetical protein
MSKVPEKELEENGKLIQEHLENINMDPWYFIYQVYVNPLESDD